MTRSCDPQVKELVAVVDVSARPDRLAVKRDDIPNLLLQGWIQPNDTPATLAQRAHERLRRAIRSADPSWSRGLHALYGLEAPYSHVTSRARRTAANELLLQEARGIFVAVETFRDRYEDAYHEAIARALFAPSASEPVPYDLRAGDISRMRYRRIDVPRPEEITSDEVRRTVNWAELYRHYRWIEDAGRDVVAHDVMQGLVLANGAKSQTFDGEAWTLRDVTLGYLWDYGRVEYGFHVLESGGWDLLLPSRADEWEFETLRGYFCGFDVLSDRDIRRLRVLVHASERTWAGFRYAFDDDRDADMLEEFRRNCRAAGSFESEGSWWDTITVMQALGIVLTRNFRAGAEHPYCFARVVQKFPHEFGRTFAQGLLSRRQNLSIGATLRAVMTTQHSDD